VGGQRGESSALLALLSLFRAWTEASIAWAAGRDQVWEALDSNIRGFGGDCRLRVLRSTRTVVWRGRQGGMGEV